jgi:type II secretion system protein N
MSTDSEYGAATQSSEANTPPEKRSVAKMVGLTVLFFILIFVFTIFKLPQVRITSLLQGYVQVALDPYGIYLTDRGRELSMLHGFRYTLEHPVLEFADQTRVELDDIVVTPKFLTLFSGKFGANVTLHQGPSSIVLDGAGRGDKIDARIELDHADIGKLGLLSYLASLKGSGEISGTANIAGSLADLPTLTGLIDLRLKNLKLDEQNIMGFQLPGLVISDGSIHVDIRGGKLVIKTFQLGKGTDDLILNLTGDVTLNRFLNGSALNLRATFALSDRIKQSLGLLDSLLSGGKTADGKYAYKLTGTLGAPFPSPDVPAGK